MPAICEPGRGGRTGSKGEEGQRETKELRAFFKRGSGKGGAEVNATRTLRQGAKGRKFARLLLLAIFPPYRSSFLANHTTPSRIAKTCGRGQIEKRSLSRNRRSVRRALSVETSERGPSPPWPLPP